MYSIIILPLLKASNDPIHHNNKCLFPNRLNDENGPRKVSRSSTNQLIADVANGLAAHIEGKIFKSRIEVDNSMQKVGGNTDLI